MHQEDTDLTLHGDTTLLFQTEEESLSLPLVNSLANENPLYFKPLVYSNWVIVYNSLPNSPLFSIEKHTSLLSSGPPAPTLIYHIVLLGACLSWIVILFQNKCIFPGKITSSYVFVCLFLKVIDAWWQWWDTDRTPNNSGVHGQAGVTPPQSWWGSLLSCQLGIEKFSPGF